MFGEIIGAISNFMYSYLLIIMLIRCRPVLHFAYSYGAGTFV